MGSFSSHFSLISKIFLVVLCVPFYSAVRLRCATMSYTAPDPHTVHVEVAADASKSDVQTAIDRALKAKFTDLTTPSKNEIIIHVKFGS